MVTLPLGDSALAALAPGRWAFMVYTSIGAVP